jgi:hypothetical protein
MVLNKKAMQIILMNRKLIDFGLIDDVAFSRLGKRLSFEIHELSSIDIRSVTQLYETTVDKLAKYCHVRGRSEIKQDTDMEIFLEILEKVL